ncbi:hypothetical protein [Halomonas heilongjiangensis]|uniref:Uncharacterized protein n=1 Tax=Halomonas heilongjiangensis TaxID=1387883 RepID=A0A2N7TU77_9GAMM|nr:hypothetical protein [Halomonas heilongjiangensis]PMR71744.1 hypothetical protein C1H66_01530 [Halomonas heilongjiangensis]PXX89974.1 hypothetical protein CR158_10345 [Halomonas heilongjiangensis]
MESINKKNGFIRSLFFNKSGQFRILGFLRIRTIIATLVTFTCAYSILVPYMNEWGWISFGLESVITDSGLRYGDLYYGIAIIAFFLGSGMLGLMINDWVADIFGLHPDGH